MASKLSSREQSETVNRFGYFYRNRFAFRLDMQAAGGKQGTMKIRQSPDLTASSTHNPQTLECVRPKVRSTRKKMSKFNYKKSRQNLKKKTGG